MSIVMTILRVVRRLVGLRIQVLVRIWGMRGWRVIWWPRLLLSSPSFDYVMEIYGFVDLLLYLEAICQLIIFFLTINLDKSLCLNEEENGRTTWGRGRIDLKSQGRNNKKGISYRCEPQNLKHSNKADSIKIFKVSLTKSILKKIPIISVITGTGFAIWRAYKGEYKRALA